MPYPPLGEPRYIVEEAYDPAKFEGRCLAGCGKGPWRDTDNTWPVAMAKRHTQHTGHETEVTTVSVLHVRAKGVK